MWLYKLIVAILRFWMWLTRCKVVGLEKLPATGPVVIMSNHTHWSDPVYLAVIYKKRQVHFMAKQEFFKNKLFGKFLTYVGSFAISRGEADIASLKNAFGYMRRKEVMGIFPEGTRNLGQGLLEFKQGATLIAYKGRATIAPIGIKNAKNFLAFWRPRPQIMVGDPICFENTENMANQQIVDKYSTIAHSAVLHLIKK